MGERRKERGMRAEEERRAAWVQRGAGLDPFMLAVLPGGEGVLTFRVALLPLPGAMLTFLMAGAAPSAQAAEVNMWHAGWRPW